MDSEFASNGNESDRIFASSSRSRLGNVLAVRLLPQPTVEDFSHPIAGTFGQWFGCIADRFGGVCMHLKMFILSASAVALWLAPLSALDKKVSWHKAVQGVSLCAAVACAVKAGNIAQRLAQESEIEVIKERAITADVVDEIATSAYVSQAQRQREAELLIADNGDRELLERALALSSEDSSSENGELVANADAELKERILQLQARGCGKGKIISEIWQVSKGGSEKYKAAEAEYRRLVGE